MINIGIGEFIISCGQAVNDMWEILKEVDQVTLLKAAAALGAAYVLYRITSLTLQRSLADSNIINRVRKLLGGLVRAPATVIDYAVNCVITGFVKSGSWVKGLFVKKAVVEKTPAEGVAESMAV